VGHLTEREFLALSLFDAFDREHAGMIKAGLSTRWPEDAEDERDWIAETMREITGGHVTENPKG
jgi:hypothetical protein